MPLTTVNGHVLLPHYPDWTRPVEWSRSWRTDVDRSLSGSEERRALRPKPRTSVTWNILPYDVTEEARLLARLRAAAKSGLACAPYWGRGLRIVSAVGTALELEANAWGWVQMNDYLFLRTLRADAPDAFELVQVGAIAGDTITLKAALALAWENGAWAWPLIFGRLTFGELTHRTDWHAGVTVTLSQLVIRPDPSPWEDVCFIDPWGANEAWHNFPVGEFILDPVEPTLLQNITFSCLAPWIATSWVEQWVDVCFIDPWGANESWRNLPVGEFTLDVFEPTLLGVQTFSCLAPWYASLWGSYGLIESWQPLANFTFTGLEHQFNAHGVWWTYPLVLGPTWSCAWLGEYGGWETWANLANGTVGSQWTGTQNIFSPDVGHQGLVTWYAAAWT